MNPLFHTEFSISDSLKNVRKSVLIYETIILGIGGVQVDFNEKTINILYNPISIGNCNIRSRLGVYYKFTNI